MSTRPGVPESIGLAGFIGEVCFTVAGSGKNAPKLYKEFIDAPLTIVLWDGQTQRWKVGTPFYDYIFSRHVSFRFCIFASFQPTYLSHVST
jgi:hypothetical protein